MPTTPHTSCRRGKRVRVVTQSGQVIIDKFVERTGKGIILRKTGFLRGRDIKAFSLFRAPGFDIPEKSE